MITGILDTNVLLQSIIGSPRSASFRTLEANEAGKYRLIFSPATIDELIEVLLLPLMRDRHGWNDDEIVRFVTTLLADATLCVRGQTVSAKVTRDVSDVKFLSLAVEARADYLVTNDRRHLLRLKRYQHTKIVTPMRFLRELD